MAEKPDPDQPIATSVDMVAWTTRLLIQPLRDQGHFSGKHWDHMLSPQITRMKIQVKRIMFESLQAHAPNDPLTQTVDWTQVQTETSYTR